MNVICRGQKEEDFSVDFSEHKIFIGQAQTDGIVVCAAGISDHHAVLSENEDRLYIADNNSLNGTFVNRKKITDRSELCSGDTIQIGIQQIRVDINKDSCTAVLHFVSNILDEDNSEDVTAMTVLPDERLQSMIEAERNAHALNGDVTQKIVITTPGDVFIDGKDVGKYTIIKRIGKGGMGEVYLAKHRTLGTLRALKVLPKAMKAENTKFYERFLREARLAAEIKHSNVVGVMDVETDEDCGFSYIVMEYIDGGSLRRILKSSNHLSEEQAVIIVEAVAEALHAAEERKIVHRDIKPDNIMFTKQGEVKLADLGIAKNNEDDSELTRENSMIGTPAYLSPEQARNAKDVDIRADIYSLGATFYEMLTGQHPYSGKDPYEILNNLFFSPVPDPRKINPEISDASAEIVMKMLAKDADDRFQTAAELIAVMEKTFPVRTSGEAAELVKKAISGVCEDDALFRSEITAVHIKKKRKFNYLSGVIAVLACILLAAAGSIGYLYWQQSNEPAHPVRPHLPPSPPPPEEKFSLFVNTSPNANVKLENDSGTQFTYSADNSGSLEIPRLKKGSYKLKVTLPDHFAWIEKIEISEQTERNIRLVPDVITVKIDSVPGARVELSAPGVAKEASVPESGILVLPGLYKRNYKVRVAHEGFFPFDKEILLNTDRTIKLPLEFVLKTLSLITTPNATVELYQNSKLDKFGKADATGRCLLQGIRKGTYELQLSAPGYEKNSSILTFDDDLNLKIPLKIQYYSLSLTTQNDVKVSVKQNGKSVAEFAVPQSGFYRLENLTAGRYDLVLSRTGFNSQECTVDLKSDVSVRIDLNKIEEKPQAVAVPAPVPAVVREVKKPPQEKQGSICFKLAFADNTPEMMKNFISKQNLQISVGTEEWNTVSSFPYTVKRKVGECRIRVRCPGLQSIVDSVTVEENKTVDYLIIPYASASQVSFSSNHAETVFLLDGKRYVKGQKVTIEPFKVYTVTAVYDSRKITKDFVCKYPGEPIVVDCPFKDIVHPFQYKYEEGLALYRNQKYEEALVPLLEAAKNNHPDAACMVAEIYSMRLSAWMWIPKEKEAEKWYLKAAELGNKKAAYPAAESIKEDSRNGTVEQMLKYYAAAVSIKNAAAAYQLSLFYRDGIRNVAADVEKEFYYLRKAADWGYPDAMYDLGMKYEDGIGIPANSELAQFWIRKAAEAGHKKARDYIDALQ